MEVRWTIQPEPIPTLQNFLKHVESQTEAAVKDMYNIPMAAD